jgi:hypothetical protein
VHASRVRDRVALTPPCCLPLPLQSGVVQCAVQLSDGIVFMIMTFPGTRGDTHQFKLNGMMDSTAQVREEHSREMMDSTAQVREEHSREMMDSTAQASRGRFSEREETHS